MKRSNIRFYFNFSKFEHLLERGFRLCKFATVGISGLVLDFSITWYLLDTLGLNSFIANSFGFIVAVANNYYLNKRWTFNQVGPSSMSQFGTFLLVASFGLLLNSLIIFLLSENSAIDFMYCKSIATVIVFIWNFAMSSKLTFKYFDNPTDINKCNDFEGS